MHHTHTLAQTLSRLYWRSRNSCVWHKNAKCRKLSLRCDMRRKSRTVTLMVNICLVGMSFRYIWRSQQFCVYQMADDWLNCDGWYTEMQRPKKNGFAAPRSRCVDLVSFRGIFVLYFFVCHSLCPLGVKFEGIFSSFLWGLLGLQAQNTAQHNTTVKLEARLIANNKYTTTRSHNGGQIKSEQRVKWARQTERRSMPHTQCRREDAHTYNTYNIHTNIDTDVSQASQCKREQKKR